MPYLQWESRIGQIRMAHCIDKFSRKGASESSSSKSETKTGISISSTDELLAKPDKKRKDISISISNQTRKDSTQYIRKDPTKYTTLGPYLMSIARIYQEMNYEPDRRLLKTYLTQSPPLHVRRTLHQSYYWTREDTKSLDENQVVYRGTHGIKADGKLLMVDQLWLWVLDESKFSTCSENFLQLD